MTKRIFDMFFAIISLLFFSWLLFLLFLLSIYDTNTFGFFVQKRIGQYGNSFSIYKLRTIHPKTFRISLIGRFLRKFKFDELPQLFNVLNGSMSFVGPRPDVAGYYDELQGEEQHILKLKPGLTSEAALKYVHEESLLLKQKNPLHYNDTVIFPDKVRLNLEYYYTQSFFGDLKIIWKTVLFVFRF